MEYNLITAVAGRSEPLILSHRGSAMDYTQNTMLAFRKSLEEGADGIEFDIRLSADGVPVIVHDNEINVQGETLTIDQTPWSDLARLRFEADQSIPRLEDVLASFGNRCLLLLELKTLEAVNPCADLIDRCNLRGINVCSFIPEAVTAWKLRNFQIPAFLNTGSLHWKPKGLWREHFPEKTALNCGADGISCYQRFLNYRQVNAAKAVAGPLLTWSSLFDERSGVAWVDQVLDYYPAVIMTARPGQMRRHLTERLSRHRHQLAISSARR